MEMRKDLSDWSQIVMARRMGQGISETADFVDVPGMQWLELSKISLKQAPRTCPYGLTEQKSYCITNS